VCVCVGGEGLRKHRGGGGHFRYTLEIVQLVIIKHIVFIRGEAIILLMFAYFDSSSSPSLLKK